MTALATAPNNPQILLYSSLVHLRRDDIEKARSSLEQAVEGGYPLVLLQTEPAFEQIRSDEWFISMSKQN